MDRQSLANTKKLIQPNLQPTTPLHPRLHAQRKEISKGLSCKKQNVAQGGTKKAKNSEKIEGGLSPYEGDHRETLQYLEQGEQGDSDYEFSAEIMQINPRQQSRPIRQKGKLCHLIIYDWMMRVSTLLKLSKECFYRGIIIMKKFMFLDQKKPDAKVNLPNANLYGLAALLISSKFENVNGNFLANISHIADENSGQIDKSCILECEVYILSTMRFHIANCSIIVESIVTVLDAWEEATAHTELKDFRFTHLDVLDEEDFFWKKQEKTGRSGIKSLMQTFIYLVDFMMMRKLVELRIKDLNSMDNHSFFRKIISNVLLHLVSYLINCSHKQQLKSYRKVSRSFTSRLGFNRQDILSMQRKSHLLSKQIRTIFANGSIKSQNLHKMGNENNQVVKSYCICHIGESSTKYLAPEQSDSLQKQENSNKINNEQLISKREDEHDTDPLLSELAIRQANELISSPTSQIGGFSEHYKVKICSSCIQSKGLLRGIVNQQFYLPLFVSKQA